MITEAGEELVEGGAGEGPLKGSRGWLVVVLNGERSLLETGEGGALIVASLLALLKRLLSYPSSGDLRLKPERADGDSALRRVQRAALGRWKEGYGSWDRRVQDCGRQTATGVGASLPANLMPPGPVTAGARSSDR